MNLSKSQYTKYRGCPKNLWLYRNKKEAVSPAGPAAQKNRERGQLIGALARKRFPGGVLVENGWQNPQEAIKRTQELMAQGVPAIYEAAFSYNGILVFVDILEKTPTGWNLVEVKSSTGNPEKPHDIDPTYLDDISIQRYVLTHCGVTPEHCYLMCINPQYVLETDEVNVEQFFLLLCADSELLSAQDIEDDFEKIEKLLAGPEPEAELNKTGCAGCECHDYCWKDIPDGSVFEICQKSVTARKYIAQGILRVVDLPPNSFKNETTNRWLEVYRTGKTYINRAGVAAWLNKLEFPLYYLDFETTNPAVPRWKNSRPYQQIPFQFSLHVQREPNGPFEHYEYLSVGKEDPRPGCAAALLKYIGASGTLIAHNAGFEKSCIKGLVRDVPLSKEDSCRLSGMTQRFTDTGDVFKKDYLHPKMKCGWTIKKVLPALVPEMSYEGMAVANGGDAMDAFDVLYEQKLPPDELEQLRKDLLKYCEQDTWAMVKIVDVLRDSVQ